MEENDAIRILRNHAAQSAEEWAREIANVRGCGIDLTFAEARAEHILAIIRAIKVVKEAL
jgi:hypothetical protein